MRIIRLKCQLAVASGELAHDHAACHLCPIMKSDRNCGALSNSVCPRTSRRPARRRTQWKRNLHDCWLSSCLVAGVAQGNTAAAKSTVVRGAEQGRNRVGGGQHRHQQHHHRQDRRWEQTCQTKYETPCPATTTSPALSSFAKVSLMKFAEHYWLAFRGALCCCCCCCLIGSVLGICSSDEIGNVEIRF